MQNDNNTRTYKSGIFSNRCCVVSTMGTPKCNKGDDKNIKACRNSDNQTRGEARKMSILLKISNNMLWSDEREMLLEELNKQAMAINATFKSVSASIDNSGLYPQLYIGAKQ